MPLHPNSSAKRSGRPSPAGAGRTSHIHVLSAYSYSSTLLSAYADAFHEVEDKDLAVAHLPGLGAFYNGADRGSTKA